jgi:hypothetical protein
MMYKRTLMSLAMIAAIGATPAFANYFSDPASNTQLNIGSAPTPTPSDLQVIGDSDRTGPDRDARPEYQSMRDMSPAQLHQLGGRSVYGAHREYLGTVLTVNDRRQLADIQTSRGVAVSVPTSLLEVRGQRIVAPTISHEDIMAMAREQNGRDVSLNERR